MLVPSVFVDIVVIGVRVLIRDFTALRRYRPRDLFSDLHRFHIRRYRRRQFRLLRLTYGDIIAVCIHRTRSGAFYVCGNSVLARFSRRIGECILRSILRRLGHQIPCILIYVEIVRIISGAAGCIRFPRNRLAEFNIRRFGRHRNRKRLCAFGNRCDRNRLSFCISSYIVLRICKGGNRHIAETFFVSQVILQFGNAVFNIAFDDTNHRTIAGQEHRHMFLPVRIAQEYQIALLRLITPILQHTFQRSAHIGGSRLNREIRKIRAIGTIADKECVPVRPSFSIPIAVMCIALYFAVGQDKVADAFTITNLTLYDFDEISARIIGMIKAFRLLLPCSFGFRRTIRYQRATIGICSRPLRIGNRYGICIFAILFRRINEFQSSSISGRFIHGRRFFMHQFRPKSNFVFDIIGRDSTLNAVLHMPCALANYGIIRSAGFNRQRKCFLFTFVDFLFGNGFIRQIPLRFTGRIGSIRLIPIFLFAVFTPGFFLRRLRFCFRFCRGVLFRFGRFFFHCGFFRHRFFLYSRSFRFRLRRRFLYNFFHLHLFRKRIRKNRRENVHTANSKRQRHQQRREPSEMFSVKSHVLPS